MAESDLDFIEANQVMQAVDERLEKLYAARERRRRLGEAVGSREGWDNADAALSLGKLESAKRKLSVRWYSDLPEQMDDITAAKAEAAR